MALNCRASAAVLEAPKIAEREDESYQAEYRGGGQRVGFSIAERRGWILDAAYISTISALAGSVIGGLTTGFTTWLSQRSQARAGMIAHDLARREDLVRDFIIAASKTYGDAIGNNEPKMPEIVDLYAMVNRTRVLGMRKTTTCADVVMRSIIDTYFGPNRTVADLRELVRTGQGIDPLKDFSEAAREELRGFALL
jgi:hypothetical protein